MPAFTPCEGRRCSAGKAVPSRKRVIIVHIVKCNYCNEQSDTDIVNCMCLWFMDRSLYGTMLVGFVQVRRSGASLRLMRSAVINLRLRSAQRKPSTLSDCVTRRSNCSTPTWTRATWSTLDALFSLLHPPLPAVRRRLRCVLVHRQKAHPLCVHPPFPTHLGLLSCRCFLVPRAGSGVVRIDPLRFLAGCRTKRRNHAHVCPLSSVLA